MCLFENSKILETGIKMMQPDMIRTINGYKAYYTIDDMISQIYTFEVKKEKLILDTTVPDASVDLLFFEKTSGEFGARIIGPTKSRLSSYVVFEENTSYIGIRFKPCYPIMISGIPVKESYNHIIPITISDNIYKRIKWYLKMSTETDEILLQIKSDLSKYIVVYDDGKQRLINGIIDYFICQKGQMNMKILSEKTGYSSYYLNKVFLAHTNYTVGQFYSLLRLHSILNQYEYNKAISQNKINYACIANETGYCDQAHLTREFKKFMGITPKKYWDKYNSNL